jgi:hypothetical protein
VTFLWNKVPGNPVSDPVTVSQPYSGIIRPQGLEVDMRNLAVLASTVPEKMVRVQIRMIKILELNPVIQGLPY